MRATTTDGTGTTSRRSWRRDMPLDIEAASVQTYLTLLQNNLARMANNSAACKTWCVTIVAAVLAVTIDSNSGAVAYAAVLPVVVFALLDSYYLSLERDYRELYSRFVARLRERDADVEDLFEMRPGPGDGERLKATLRSFGSVSVWPVYAVMLIAALGTAVILGS